MKFIWCPECDDKYRIPVSEGPKFCECGQSWGRYVGPAVKQEFVDGEEGQILAREWFENVLVGGAARVFGIGNELFEAAAQNKSFVFIGWFYNGQTIGTEHIHHERDVHMEEKNV